MNRRILILDDDEDILDILSIILEDSGYQIKALANGEYVFETIEKFKPDLVLMYVMLANFDGRVICKNLKKNAETKRIPVILISASHDLAKSLAQQGAPDDFIAKPFDIGHLIHKVETYLKAA
jgi:DNA-binding response OmpR family regulator